MEARVIMAKCHKSKEPFGIRAQKMENKWVFTWAFKLSDKVAKSEGFDQSKISGVITIDSKYPGCPHCSARSFYQCCKSNKIVCWGHEGLVNCPHCGYTGKIGASRESFDNIDGGAY